VKQQLLFLGQSKATAHTSEKSRHVQVWS
jgi:hypothetical protein